MKICNRCNVAKDLTEFREAVGYRDGYKLQCLDCLKEMGNEYHHRTKHKRAYIYEDDRDRKLKKAYGISYKEYLNMLECQNGGCAICGTTSTGKRRAFAVDHCHSTGKVRGLLCSNCNTGIGNLRDSVALLERAIQYLK